MLDLSNLTGANGTKFVIHLENQADLAKIEHQFHDNASLLAFVQDGADFDLGGSNLGPDKIVHAMFAKNRRVTYLTEEKYVEWAKTGDWQNVDPDGDNEPEASLNDVLSMLLGGGSHSNFTGPTDDQIAKYASNPTAQMISGEDANCSFCLRPTGGCIGRDASFDEAAFDAEILTRKAALN